MDTVIAKQRDFFESGATQSYAFRLAQLDALYSGIKSVEQELCIALAKDFSKSYFETYTSEIIATLLEIKHARRKLKSWMKPKRANGGILNFGANSSIVPQARGVSLIISPWNYPFQLALSPLVSAIAAGNCVVIKPSEITANTSKVITELIHKIFDAEYVAVIEGGVTIAQELLKKEFDHIFFTGSPKVGKMVIAAAAKHLTPITLELGGKSPCIVEPHKNMKVAAERIISGKMFNAGQTCVAPDYLLVHSSIKEAFVEELKGAITKFYGLEPLYSNDLPHLVNEHHFNRVLAYLKDGEVLHGGRYDEALHKLEPTLLVPDSLVASVMKHEIFGPVLPIISYDTFDEVYPIIAKNPYPLALYLFGDEPSRFEEVLKRVRFGGGCYNDTLSHILSLHMPFGGVRTSGIGSYHGKYGFDAFSHQVSVVKKRLLFNFPFRNPPYHDGVVDLLKKVM